MLALIALANVSWHLSGRPTVAMTAHVPSVSTSDTVLRTVMTIAVDGRAYPLFAVLFGYGMVQFFRSRTARGIAVRDVRRMLRRRHGAMLLIGALHAALLFMGDVLGAYAIAGLLLVWLLFSRTDRTLIVWSWILGGLLVLSAVFSVIGGIIVLSTSSPAEAAAMADASPAGFITRSREDTAGQDSYLAAAAARVVSWVPNTLAQVLGLAIPLCILLGWLGARRGLLDRPWEHRRTLRRVAVGGIGIGWAGGLLVALAGLDLVPGMESVPWMWTGLGTVTGVCCGVGYACAAGLLAARLDPRATAAADEQEPSRPRSSPVGSLLVRSLAALGERSLTFYLLQSVLFAPLLDMWGLGLGAHLGTTAALAVALVVWLVGLPLAMLLSREGRRGPAEAVLRRLTYGRYDPVGPRAWPAVTRP